MLSQQKIDAANRRLEIIAHDIMMQEIYLQRVAKKDPLALPTDWKKQSADQRAKWEHAKVSTMQSSIKMMETEVRYINEYIKSLQAPAPTKSKAKNTKQKA